MELMTDEIKNIDLVDGVIIVTYTIGDKNKKIFITPEMFEKVMKLIEK